MGKASEIARQLREKPLGPGERRPMRPTLRLRNDAPSIEVEDETLVETVIGRLEKEQQGVVLRDSTGKVVAVALSAGRYAELAGCEIESEDRFRVLEGEIQPDPQALDELMIEQADPADEWRFGSRIWREPGQH